MLSLPTLHVDGRNLVDAHGKVVRLPGFAAFSLFKRFLMINGWDALALPNLTEYRAVATEAGYPADAPLVVRVFRHGGPWNPFSLVPWAYTMEQVRDFAQKCAEQGFIIDWTAGDYQVCFSAANPLDGPRGIHEHHNQFTSAIAGITSIWNVTNESFKNGLDPRDAPPPPWAPVIQYSGNYDDNRDRSADLACINLHTDRSQEAGAEKWVGKGFESAPYLWAANKPIFYDEGMGADETYIGGRRSNVPAHFFIKGQELSAVSAAYFHSTDGIWGNGFRPITRQCAVAFMRGAVGALAMQGGI